MSKEDTKRHFAEICESIWSKIEHQERLEKATAEKMRQIVANMAMIAWNMCLIHKSADETKKALRRLAEEKYDGSPCALTPLMDTAELKWLDYRDDHELISKVEVKTVDGKPKAVAYLKGECPEVSSKFAEFQAFLNSPEIQERLRHTSPDKLEEEIGKIAAEYNATLLSPISAGDDADDGDDDDEDTYKREFPLPREELDLAYQIMREAPQEEKKKMLAHVLSGHSFLAPLCKNAATAKFVPDVILAVTSAYIPDTHLIGFGEDHFKNGLKLAQGLVSDFLDDKKRFPALVEGFGEPNLFTFLAETVDGFKLPPKEFKNTLSTLITWGLLIEGARRVEHPDEYEDLQDDEGEEEYDFDKKNLQVLQLHVKLRGFRCSADVLVREDCTFEDLHDFLNPLFSREDDHLYRFECEDGCTAVRDEEDIDDDEVLSSECYVGHHLSPGSGAYYLFDYGDEWEHDITVKKVIALDPKEKYPKVLKITGKIPEQYPDYDEEDEE